MYFIAVGAIFVFFYLDLDLGTLTIDLLPDIAGYALIAYNAWKLQPKSWSFQIAMWVSAAMGVYSVVIRIWAPTGLPGLVVSLVETGGTVWLLKLLSKGVSEIEDAEKVSLRWPSLDRWCTLAIAGYLAVMACTIAVQFIDFIGFFSLMVVALWFVFCVGLTVCFFRAASRYAKRDGGGKNGKKLIRGPLPPHVG